LDYDYHKTVEKGHGRIETREYRIVGEDSFEVNGQWGGLHAVGMVKSERMIDGVSSSERRYYICSSRLSGEAFAKAVRGHWGIENSLHWVLDVAFREDDCRIRKANGPQNFGLLRRFALSLLKQEKAISKLGVKSKRKRCGWDNDYLLAVIIGN
jgi:predicted transposase YbfD/YdcC